MSWITIVVGGYLVFGAISGLRRGLLFELFTLAGYLVGIVLAMKYQAAIVKDLMKSLPINRWALDILPKSSLANPLVKTQAAHLTHTLVTLLVFLVIVGAAEFVGRIIGEMITHTISTFRVSRMVNQVGGGVAGVAEHGLLVGLAVSVLVTLPMLQHSALIVQLDHNPMTLTLASWFHQVVHVSGESYFL